MTPLTKTTPVLEEASRIKKRLLGIQTDIETLSETAADQMLESARRQLGYDHGETVSDKLTDTRITGKTTVISPKLLGDVLPVSERSAKTTADGRRAATAILHHRDSRLLVIVGPCSIHDPKSALEYAEHIKKWRRRYGNQLEIVMRAYIEKPRTELGWKGFVYDPLLDGSDDINLGLVATRMLTCQITDLGVPLAVERLNALTPQYLNALIAYDVIGARNTTDQKAREYASATSCPVGFKNSPEGSIQVAIQAIVAAKGKHAFLGIDLNGATKQINSDGNDTGHVILRGDNRGPNYSPEHIAKTKKALKAKGLEESIVVDASHGNSGKKAANQMKVIDGVCEQVASGETAICGVMIESNLVAGNQKPAKLENLTYGQSITDECVDVAEAEKMLAQLAEAVGQRRRTLEE